MSSVIRDLESLGAGVFLSHQGIDSRLTESELWRAFEQPVLIWVHGALFDDSKLEALITASRRIPHIRRFRFTNTRVTPLGVRRLYEFCQKFQSRELRSNPRPSLDAAIALRFFFGRHRRRASEPERSADSLP